MFTGFELYSRWVPLRTHVFESPVNESNLVMYRRTDIMSIKAKTVQTKPILSFTLTAKRTVLIT